MIDFLGKGDRITIQEPYQAVVPLTPERILLEIYNTIIGTLQSVAMVLLFFFLVALLAVVIVHVFELRNDRSEMKRNASGEVGTQAAKPA